MKPVPFDLPDVGIREISGKLYVEIPYLALKITGGLLGEFDKDEQVIKIEFDALDEVNLKRGVARDNIILHPKKPELLEVVPGNHNDNRASFVARCDGQRHPIIKNNDMKMTSAVYLSCPKNRAKFNCYRSIVQRYRSDSC